MQHIKHTQPKPLQQWLTAQGSLTAQFEALAGQPLRVKPVFEGFDMLTHSAAQSLCLPRAQMAWVREVFLYGSDDAPWAMAQSIFPITTLRGKARRLRHLGHTPLGYVLFARSKPVCERAITQTEVDGEWCWTRQNYYDWLGGRILVQETFLPAFLSRLEREY